MCDFQHQMLKKSTKLLLENIMRKERTVNNQCTVLNEFASWRQTLTEQKQIVFNE
jgi:hypothetical protein